MNDLIVGAGLVLVAEGLLWALAPGLGLAALRAAAAAPESSLRLAGVVAVAVGCAIVWAVRG